MKNQVKVLDENIKAIENSLKDELGNAERGSVSDFIVVWKTLNSNRVDSKKLKEKYPDIYKEVTKSIVSRRFEIKEVN